jgi:hypothetical protein
MFENKINNPHLILVLNIFFLKNNSSGRISKNKIVVISISLFILIILSALLQNTKLNIAGVILALFISFFVCLFLLIACISMCINENNNIGKYFSLLINILFTVTPIIFINNFSVLNEVYFKILNHVILIFMIFCLYNLVEIKKGNDFSDLKAMNMFFAAILSAIVFFPNKSIINDNINNVLVSFQNIFGYYYIVPLMMLQALYEVLGKKCK